MKYIAASGGGLLVASAYSGSVLPLVLGLLLWAFVAVVLLVAWLRRASSRQRVAELDRKWVREMIGYLRNYPEDQAWLYGHFRLAGVPAPPGIKPLPPKGPSGISLPPPPNPGRVTGGLPRRNIPLPATSAYLEEIDARRGLPMKRELR